MKRSEQVILFTGIMVLALAAIFMISLMPQLFNFGSEGPGGGTMLYTFGHMIFSVYGFSSLLIPVFLFTVAIVMFSPEWNDRKGIFLTASVIPFLTVAGIESFTNTIFMGESLAVNVIKVTSFFLASLLLCAIEYIIIGLVADAILQAREKAKNNAMQSEDSSPVDKVQNFPDAMPSEQELSEKTPLVQEKTLPNIINLTEGEAYPLFEKDFLNDDELLPEFDRTLEEALLQDSDSFNAKGSSLEDEYAFEADFFSEIQTLDSSDNSSSPPSFDDAFEVGNLLEAELLSDANVAIHPEINLDYRPFDYADSVEDINQSEEIKQSVRTPQNIQLQSDSEENNTIPTFEFGANLDLEQNSRSSTLIEADIDEYEHEVLEDEFIDIEIDDDEEATPISDFTEAELPNEESPSSIAPSSTVPMRQRNAPYHVPVEGILTTYPDGEYWVIDDQTRRAGNTLKETLNEFKIEAEVTGIRKGPVVTMFEILPAPGVKLSKIVALGDNIALRLAASSVRIVAPIPGRHAVGIEVPNKVRSIVSFKELIDTDIPAFHKMAIPVVLGKDIAGDAQVLDLAKTPHLLIAGSTGSGKSVCVNTMILSILYKRSPQDVRMILIDPKIVELKLYNDIPHLLTPVITEPKRAFQALQYCLCEMERRYALLDGMGVRDINSYNQRIKERNIATEKLPYIVLVIDEFADLMATTGKELESTVARLAAMSRAIGIHIVLATQRPSIDVITGLIKANIPTRIAFMVASKMDSRIIIDQMGAEKLLGKGDMLYASAVDPFPVRIQGTFVSDDEVENVVQYIKQYGKPDYIDDEIFVDDEDEGFEQPLFGDGDDPLYDKALEIVMMAGKASASYIQRRLKIGYNRAARLVEDMEARGIVGPANGSKAREVLHMV